MIILTNCKNISLIIKKKRKIIFQLKKKYILTKKIWNKIKLNKNRKLNHIKSNYFLLKK